MKIAIRSLVVVVILALLGFLGWPEIHTRLIIRRVRYVIEQNHRLDFSRPRARPVFSAFVTLDPPERILEALWRIAVSPDSTPTELDDVGFTLTFLSIPNGYEFFMRPGETVDDWNEACADFFRRWTADPAPGDVTLTLGFHKLEDDWRLAHP